MSVMIRSTTPLPVNGKLHVSKILCAPPAEENNAEHTVRMFFSATAPIYGQQALK